MWYQSSGGQSLSHTSQLTASVVEEIGCITRHFIVIADISAGFSSKRSCLEACGLVAVPAQPNCVCMQTRNSCMVANPEQSPFSCVTPPAALRAKQGPTNCSSSFSIPLPDSMAGQFTSLQHPAGRPKNISHIPTKHGF